MHTIIIIAPDYVECEITFDGNLQVLHTDPPGYEAWAQERLEQERK